jgi:hypothetical protein
MVQSPKKQCELLDGLIQTDEKTESNWGEVRMFEDYMPKEKIGCLIDNGGHDGQDLILPLFSHRFPAQIAELFRKQTGKASSSPRLFDWVLRSELFEDLNLRVAESRRGL